MGEFDRDYAFCADAKATTTSAAASFQSIVRADGRVATRNYIASSPASTARHGGAPDSRAFEIRLDAFPECRRRGRAHAQERLRHASEASPWRCCGRPWPATRATPISSRCSSSAWLRGKPDCEPACRAATQAQRHARRLHHSGKRRHDEGGGRRHRAHRSVLPKPTG